MITKMFFITNLLLVVMITLHKTKKVSFYYLMSIIYKKNNWGGVSLHDIQILKSYFF